MENGKLLERIIQARHATSRHHSTTYGDDSVIKAGQNLQEAWMTFDLRKKAEIAAQNKKLAIKLY